MKFHTQLGNARDTYAVGQILNYIFYISLLSYPLPGHAIQALLPDQQD